MLRELARAPLNAHVLGRSFGKVPGKSGLGAEVRGACYDEKAGPYFALPIDRGRSRIVAFGRVKGGCSNGVEISMKLQPYHVLKQRQRMAELHKRRRGFQRHQESPARSSMSGRGPPFSHALIIVRFVFLSFS